MADAAGLNPAARKAWGFESLLRHHGCFGDVTRPRFLAIHARRDWKSDFRAGSIRSMWAYLCRAGGSRPMSRTTMHRVHG